MTVDRVNLKVINEKHHAYRDAFDISVQREYFEIICQFLEDATLAPSNSDDLELISDLLFQSKFGRVHIQFAGFICDLALNDTSKGKSINRFMEYLSCLAPHYLEDFCHNLLRNYGSAFVPEIIIYLNANFRLKLAETAAQFYPRIFRAVPKLKTYLLFS